jgi:hypothetical protein
VGLFDGRRERVDVSPDSAIVHTADLQDEVRWSQPFHWGLLLAFDDAADADWEIPGDIREGHVSATPTCLAVPVLHSADVVFDEEADPDTPLPEAEVEVVLAARPLQKRPNYAGVLRCPSGQLQVGDADEYCLVQVPRGDLNVAVWLEPREHADRVVIALNGR